MHNAKLIHCISIATILCLTISTSASGSGADVLTTEAQSVARYFAHDKLGKFTFYRASSLRPLRVHGTGAFGSQDAISWDVIDCRNSEALCLNAGIFIVSIPRRPETKSWSVGNVRFDLVGCMKRGPSACEEMVVQFDGYDFGVSGTYAYSSSRGLISMRTKQKDGGDEHSGQFVLLDPIGIMLKDGK